MLQFYILMDDEKFGPYSTQGIIDLELLNDTLVQEESMDEWYPAELFDFRELLELERNSVNENLNQEASSRYQIGEDGVIKRDNLVPEGYEIGEDGVIKRKNISTVVRTPITSSYPSYTSTYSDNNDGWKTFGKVILTIIVIGVCIGIAVGTGWGTIPATPMAILAWRSIWKD